LKNAIRTSDLRFARYIPLEFIARASVSYRISTGNCDRYSLLHPEFFSVAFFRPDPGRGATRPMCHTFPHAPHGNPTGDGVVGI
jgi:hypothetical protein